MAALERGVGALAVGSGQAAQFIAAASLLEAGDEIVAAKTLYTQFDVSFRRLGIQTTLMARCKAISSFSSSSSFFGSRQVAHRRRAART